MPSVINSIVTEFKAKGAEETAASADTVNKATTRLGNTSAANGRQFAAQSQGLGGLVAAYAGAAATSFALQQAFAALQKAAQFDQVIQGTNTFSSAFGQSADSIIGNIKRITQGQLSIVDAAQTANLALSAGFNPKQLNELADVATKASRALGRDLNDSYQRIIKGAAKLEPELLDELGIFTRIEPAVEKYSAAVGKSVTSLSEFERRQAFVNAVISEGQSKFNIIDTSNASAAQSYSKLAATLTDLALTIGNVIANALAPLADYINNNISAAFGAFGIITTLILSKTNQLASEGLEKLTDRITKFSGSLSTSFVGGGKVAAQVLGELSTATTDFNNKLGKGLGDQKARRDELINLAKAGTINVNQVKELNGIVKEQITRDKESKASLEAKKATLDVTSKAYQNLTRDLDNTKTSLKQNEAQLAANNKVLDQQSKLANAASVATSAFGKAVGFLGSAIGKALSFLNLLLLVYSIINLIGPALLKAFGSFNVLDNLLEKLGEIGKNLLGLDKNSKALDAGAKGFAASVTEAAFQSENLKSNIEGLITQKAIFGLFEVNIKINAETIQRDVSDAILEGIKASEAARNELIRSSQDTGAGPLSGPIYQAQPAPTEEQLGIAAQQAYNDVIKERIKLTEKNLSSAVDTNSLKLLQAQIIAYNQVLNLGKEQLQIVGLISNTTGISTKELFKYVSATKEGTLTMKTLDGTLTGQVYTIDQINKLDKDRRQGAQDLNNIQERLVGYNYNLITNTEKLSKAQLDLNGIGKARSDLLASEQAIEDQIKQLLDSRVKVDYSRVAALSEQLEILKQQKTAFNDQATSQEAVLRVQEAIRKTFSSQITALTNISGLTDSSGKLATTELEVKRNQLAILKESASASDSITQPLLDQGVAASDLEKKMDGVQVQIYRAGNAAKQALAGSMIETIKKAVELTQEYEKQTIELDKQAKSTRLSIQRDELSLQQQINDKQREYTTLVIQNQLNAIQRQQRVNELAAERIDILRKGREDEAKSQMSGVLSPLFTDQQKRIIEIKFKEEELNDLKRTLGAQVASAAATLKKEEELAKVNQDFDNKKFDIQQKLNENDISSRTLEINTRIEEAKRQQALFEKQAQAIQEQIKAFLEHPKELSKVLSQNIQDQLEIAKINNPDKAAQFNELGKNIEERQKALDLRIVNQIEEISTRLNAAAEGVKKAQSDYLNALIEQKTALSNTAEGQQKLLDLEKKISEARTVEAVAAAQAKYNAVVAETGNKLLAATQALDILKREAERANNSFIILAVKSAEAITNNIEKSLNSLVDAIANGTLTMENFKQGFKQMIVSILSDITKALVNEAITKPIKEMVFSFTKDLIGGMSGSGAADALAKSIGSSDIAKQLTTNVGDVGKVAGGLKDVGVTSVYIMGAAPGVMCCSGQGAAEAAAGGTVAKAAEGATPAVTNAATRVASTAIPDNTGKILYNKPVGPELPAGTTADPLVVQAIPSAGAAATPGILSPEFMGTGGDAFRLGGLAQTAPGGFRTINPDLNAANPYGGMSTNLQNPYDPYQMSTGAQAVIPQGIDSRMLTDPNYLFNRNSTGQLTPGGAGWMTPGRNPSTGGEYTPGPQTENLTGGGPQIQTAGFQDALDQCKESTEGLTGGFEGFTKTLGLGDKGVTQLTQNVDSSALAQQGLQEATLISTTATQSEAALGSVIQGAKTMEVAADQAVTTAAQSAAVALSNIGGGAGGGGSSLLGGLGGGGGGEEWFADIASGGLVGGGAGWSRFAAGGGVMMRDSVPALLEPGEFVMKKSAVDSIGRNSLERMNSTGRSSGNATNIKVQVDNSGQPKQAEQGETQFDGETAIVKLILKDLNSNGPIRRSIRGNV